jgi:hypothetical protein
VFKSTHLFGYLSRFYDGNKTVKEDLSRKKITIRDLFPNLTDDQLREVKETLHNYAAIAWRVCERLEREKTEGFDAR